MTIDRRLTRLEQIGKPSLGRQMTKEEAEQFWSAHLAKLNDTQLERFEELMIKVGADDPINDDEDVRELAAQHFGPDQVAELRTMFLAMGLGEEWDHAGH
ncbi:hypothetical protein [Devosia sp. RR2S18]|uniref:hypothetical protein n=1 Tax=Devosia rhizosphaerae TaxID=3049774 RepID=UPI0025408ECD|nr:hypothetical protein [Devosia sp. RR2S18]WIJ26608.1 hypothetical protein QOV41_07610 [Devosia sp. RR2S18]